MNRLWEEEETQNRPGCGQPKLEVEDDAPGGVSDDDTSYEWAERRPDQGAG